MIGAGACVADRRRAAAMTAGMAGQRGAAVTTACAESGVRTVVVEEVAVAATVTGEGAAGMNAEAVAGVEAMNGQRRTSTAAPRRRARRKRRTATCDVGGGVSSPVVWRVGGAGAGGRGQGGRAGDRGDA